MDEIYQFPCLHRGTRWGISIVAFLVLTVLAITPVLADYIGPDREVTTWSEQRLRCEYQAVYDPPPPAQGAHGCLLVFLYVPSGTCPDAAGLGSYFNPTNCSEPPDYTWPIASCVGSYCSISFSGGLEPCSAGDYGCESIPTTVTYPEATISGSLQGCTLQNGWCVTNSTLVLTGTEPVAGQQIIGIEGTLNGQGFGYPFLPGAAVESASVPLGEGVNTLTFWALSSWGDSSQRGTFSASVDTQPPAITGSVSGTSGDHGWYISTVDVSATASDAASGVATSGGATRECGRIN